jgi:hypothetical protein
LTLADCIAIVDKKNNPSEKTDKADKKPAKKTEKADKKPSKKAPVKKAKK